MENQTNQPHGGQNKKNQSAKPSLWQQFSGSLFLILFGGVFLYFLTPEILNYFKADSWQQTPCTIVSSKVESEYNSESAQTDISPELSQAVISFIYEVQHKQYHSNRYSFINPSTSGSRANEIVLQYPVGATATCYVNMDNPAEAVLNRQFSFFSLMILIPLPFFLFGIWSFVLFVRNCFRRLF